MHPSLRITRCRPWNRASAETWLKWRWSKGNVTGIFQSSLFFWLRWASNCWKCALRKRYGCCWVKLPHRSLRPQFDSECCAQPFSWHLSFIFITLCTNCCLDVNSIISNFPRKCRFETRPNPPSKFARNAGGAHYLQLYWWPLFFVIILIITVLPFNGNSMTSGEGSSITHC